MLFLIFGLGVGVQTSYADSLARGAKVTLSVIVFSDHLCRKLGIFYILTGLFGYACPYVSELKRIVEWGGLQ